MSLGISTNTLQPQGDEYALPQNGGRNKRNKKAEKAAADATSKGLETQAAGEDHKAKTAQTGESVCGASVQIHEAVSDVAQFFGPIGKIVSSIADTGKMVWKGVGAAASHSKKVHEGKSKAAKQGAVYHKNVAENISNAAGTVSNVALTGKASKVAKDGVGDSVAEIKENKKQGKSAMEGSLVGSLFAKKNKNAGSAEAPAAAK